MLQHTIEDRFDIMNMSDIFRMMAVFKLPKDITRDQVIQAALKDPELGQYILED